MPSTEKHPSRVPMWKGVRIASAVIAGCLFPVAIAGYWAYGNLVSKYPQYPGVANFLSNRWVDYH